ncbi:AraC family transcriptional regulator [Pseudomonas rhodesiae]|uniref:helix-turn-helix domain-containing protein n=1 Tax=Pseudomonas rhodesiae TaxID=76760 RepID=UPI001BCCBAD9|nr:helix-turn-helix domain-containing protein [Pseudomonas rhodesiae]QVN04086.1 AraC family transcriptional regulator [Pseudomonas rhodesiae]
MDIYGANKLHFHDIGDASEHFQSYDNFMSITPGLNGTLDYEKRFCVMGTSFVSLSYSQSGWGYRTSNELDGFSITMPHSGFMQWRNHNGIHRAERGAFVIADQREIFLANYAAGINYTTIYISNADMAKQLTLILGYSPKSRISFDERTSERWQINSIQRLVETILDFSEKSPIFVKRVADSLKESLIGFFLCNFRNNYTLSILDPKRSITLTPHLINRAAEYMASSVDPHLTVCEVATHAGLSVRSLQMGFKKFKNTTPIVFLREQRLEKARRMLNMEDNSLTPKEIAYACGFTNYQSFCKYYSLKYFIHPSFIGQPSLRKKS